MRLRSDIWVQAYRRRCEVAGAIAVQRRKGAAEAGAIFIKIDHLDGSATLIGPAPQSAYVGEAFHRRFVIVSQPAPADVIEERLAKEIRFDPDIWIVDIEDRQGRHCLMQEELTPG
jgi:hypothetical protein